MTKEQKRAQEWVNALRSGKYKQTQGELRDNHGYCCLGVALDIFEPDGWERNPWGNALLHKYKEKTGCEMPQRSWYMRTFGSRKGLKKYATMNDTGKTFEEIATQIEKDFNLV